MRYRSGFAAVTKRLNAKMAKVFNWDLCSFRFYLTLTIVSIQFTTSKKFQIYSFIHLCCSLVREMRCGSSGKWMRGRRWHVKKTKMDTKRFVKFYNIFDSSQSTTTCSSRHPLEKWITKNNQSTRRASVRPCNYVVNNNSSSVDLIETATSKCL